MQPTMEPREFGEPTKCEYGKRPSIIFNRAQNEYRRHRLLQKTGIALPGDVVAVAVGQVQRLSRRVSDWLSKGQAFETGVGHGGFDAWTEWIGASSLSGG